MYFCVKFSTIYDNFAIFQTSESTEYATASGGLRPRPPTGAPPLTPPGDVRPPDPLTLAPFLNSKYATAIYNAW